MAAGLLPTIPLGPGGPSASLRPVFKELSPTNHFISPRPGVLSSGSLWLPEIVCKFVHVWS